VKDSSRAAISSMKDASLKLLGLIMYKQAHEKDIPLIDKSKRITVVIGILCKQQNTGALACILVDLYFVYCKNCFPET